jgi:hypothetical protein
MQDNEYEGARFLDPFYLRGEFKNRADYSSPNSRTQSATVNMRWRSDLNEMTTEPTVRPPFLEWRLSVFV